MRSMAARDAKNSFGHLIDLARAEPVLIHKHGRPVVVVMAVEAFERLSRADTPVRPSPKLTRRAGIGRARQGGDIR